MTSISVTLSASALLVLSLSSTSEPPSQRNSSSFLGRKLSVGILNSNNKLFLASTKQQQRTAVATVIFSLPTEKPERKQQWSARAIKSFAMGELEARKLKYPNTGTEALLMGIFVEGDGREVTVTHRLLGIWYEKESAGHKILASLGFDDEKAKELSVSMDKDFVHSFT